MKKYYLHKGNKVNEDPTDAIREVKFMPVSKVDPYDFDGYGNEMARCVSYIISAVILFIIGVIIFFACKTIFDVNMIFRGLPIGVILILVSIVYYIKHKRVTKKMWEQLNQLDMIEEYKLEKLLAYEDDELYKGDAPLHIWAIRKGKIVRFNTEKLVVVE